MHVTNLKKDSAGRDIVTIQVNAMCLDNFLVASRPWGRSNRGIIGSIKDASLSISEGRDFTARPLATISPIILPISAIWEVFKNFV